jgi:FlaA1/EpsC-like NDP-sugar epimerase
LALVDGGLWLVGLWVSLMVARGLGGVRPGFADVVAAAVVVPVLLAVAGVVVGTYRGRWRVGCFEEFVGMAASAGAAVGSFEVLVRLLGWGAPLWGVRVVAGLVGVGLMTVPRGLWRWVRDRHSGVGERLLVWGAGRGALAVLPALLAEGSGFCPVALLDDDPGKRYRSLFGLRVVGGRRDLSALVERFGASAVLIAIPSASAELVRELVGEIEGLGVRALIVPPPGELLGTVSDVREVTEADLLGRRVVNTDVGSIAGYLTGKRVLITGAGGSIGSELARQVFSFGPAELCLLDRDESALHATVLSMTGRALLTDDSTVLCDIRDAAAVRRVFRERRPEVVFHAAALKHVPMLERFPDEAYKTNVLGTRNVLAAAAACGVERFINISTDKAADPVNVLGLSKRVTERLTATAGLECGRPFTSVRFGNVLGSRGSMLITFRNQIKAGGPVTVTDPDATRYFMMIEEAVALTIQAGAIGGPGEVLVLDMGEPIRIRDVAELLVARSGRDIAIEYTGLRPGEKVHEALFGPDEDDHRPIHPAISHAHVPPLNHHQTATLDHIDHDHWNPRQTMHHLANTNSETPVLVAAPGLDDDSDDVVVDLRGRTVLQLEPSTLPVEAAG